MSKQYTRHDLPERDSDGKLPAYAWPGGYQIIYVTPDGCVLCADCATTALDDAEEYDENKPIAADLYQEGPDIQCETCGCLIESDYGDPDADDDDDDDAESEE